jgi:hypothetical protein
MERVCGKSMGQKGRDKEEEKVAQKGNSLG